jgi:hypothetical protein
LRLERWRVLDKNARESKVASLHAKSASMNPQTPRKPENAHKIRFARIMKCVQRILCNAEVGVAKQLLANITHRRPGKKPKRRGCTHTLPALLDLSDAAQCYRAGSVPPLLADLLDLVDNNTVNNNAVDNVAVNSLLHNTTAFHHASAYTGSLDARHDNQSRCGSVLLTTDIRFHTI